MKLGFTKTPRRSDSRMRRKSPVPVKALPMKMELRGGSRELLERGRQMRNEIRPVVNALKFQVQSLTKIICDKSNQVGSTRTNHADVTSILVKGQIETLKGQRRQIMSAVDYLQALDIEIVIAMDESQDCIHINNCEEGHPDRRMTYQLPSFPEVMEKVQSLLNGEVGIPDDHSLTSYTECESLDLSHTNDSR